MIKFLNSEAIATTGKMIFERWNDGIITTKQAAIMIAKSNDLEYVSDNEFILEARNLGYLRGPVG